MQVFRMCRRLVHQNEKFTICVPHKRYITNEFYNYVLLYNNIYYAHEYGGEYANPTLIRRYVNLHDLPFEWRCYWK